MAIFFTASIMTLISSLGNDNSLIRNKYSSNFIISILILTTIAYIPSWNLYRSDMVNYINLFLNINALEFTDLFSTKWEPLFSITVWFISKLTDSQNLFIISIYLLMVTILLFALRKLYLPQHVIFVLFAFLSYPFFYIYSFNVLRQGIAMMLIILAISLWIEKKYSLKFFLTLIAAGLFHSSSILFSTALFFMLLFRLKTRTLLFFWVISAFLFITNLNQLILNFQFIQNSSYVETYTSQRFLEAYGGQTNKLNFFIFSIFFIFLFLYLYKRQQLKEEKKIIYNLLIKVYIVFNSIFLLLGFVAYSDRVASYSWIFIPILTTYPFLHSIKDARLKIFIVLFIFFIVGLFTSPFISY